jgi:hypothetical protein
VEDDEEDNDTDIDRDDDVEIVVEEERRKSFSGRRHDFTARASVATVISSVGGNHSRKERMTRRRPNYFEGEEEKEGEEEVEGLAGFPFVKRKKMQSRNRAAATNFLGNDEEEEEEEEYRPQQRSPRGQGRVPQSDPNGRLPRHDGSKRQLKSQSNYDDLDDDDDDVVVDDDDDQQPDNNWAYDRMVSSPYGVTTGGATRDRNNSNDSVINSNIGTGAGAGSSSGVKRSRAQSAAGGYSLLSLGPQTSTRLDGTATAFRRGFGN